jgi:hypothetical protein
MTRILKTLLCLIVIAVVSLQSVSAQEKEVETSDITKMEMSARNLLRSVSYRSIQTSETFPERGKEALHKSVRTVEQESPDRTREIREIAGTQGMRRTEIVRIGDRKYTRSGDGPWQTASTVGEYGKWGDPTDVSKRRFENSARLVETVKNERNGEVSVYETVTKIIREQNGNEETSIATSRYWFTKDGKLLRKDMKFEKAGETRVSTDSTVYEFEDIKIEEPKIN